MCVAIPAQLISTQAEPGVGRTGVVLHANGSTNSVDLTLLPDAEVGDYVIIHSGFAISTMTPAEVRELNELYADLASLKPRSQSG